MDKYFLFLDLVLKCLFFCLYIWKGSVDNKKVKRLSKEEVKMNILDSIIIDEVLECEDLNREAGRLEDLERTAEIINGMKILLKRK